MPNDEMPHLGPQFDARMAAAAAVPVEERRLGRYTERRLAARQNANHWALQVDHSSHDDLQKGVPVRRQSHVLLSKDEFEDPAHAEETALLWGLSRGSYTTGVRHA